MAKLWAFYKTVDTHTLLESVMSNEGNAAMFEFWNPSVNVKGAIMSHLYFLLLINSRLYSIMVGVSVYVAALLPGQNMMLSLEKESKGVLISTLEYT